MVHRGRCRCSAAPASPALVQNPHANSQDEAHVDAIFLCAPRSISSSTLPSHFSPAAMAEAQQQRPLDFTVEKLNSLQQLQITLHAPASTSGGGTVPLAAPLCAVSNTFPFKPVLQLKQPGAAGASAPLTEVPLPARVDLADGRNRITTLPDGVTLSLHIKQGQSLVHTTMSR